jgi:O-acetyl-ADP-ribose deacetylase (regulator of RNase III)
MKTVEGDLLSLAEAGKFEVIIHGCNCFCDMAAGIAAGIKRRFPEAFEADRQTTPGDRAKLGTFTNAQVRRGDHCFTVVNAYTQYDFRGRGVKVDYEAVRSCMRKIKEAFPGTRIGLPKIGAGMAGGDWDRISQIIDEELAKEDVTLVEFKPR